MNYWLATDIINETEIRFEAYSLSTVRRETLSLAMMFAVRRESLLKEN